MDALEGWHQLLEVADTFQILGRGLIVVPDFSVPEKKLPFSSVEAIIATPDGRQLTSSLSLDMTHFNILDLSMPLAERWRLVPRFRELSKDDVPIGSRIFIRKEMFEILTGEAI